ncbi:MAG: hypothetical protein LH613_17930 [Chamaesiphon sp.]|nr:hypothetical protein [Chamaesiphon sp.]
MNNEFKIPDPETRARSIAKLRAACRLLDLFNLQLDEAIAVADAHLLEQRRTRRAKSNYLPTQFEN